MIDLKNKKEKKINEKITEIFPNRTTVAIESIRKSERYKVVEGMLKEKMKEREKEDEIGEVEPEGIESEDMKKDAENAVQEYWEGQEDLTEQEQLVKGYCNREIWLEVAQIFKPEQTPRQDKGNRKRKKKPKEINKRENRNTWKARNFKFLQRAYKKDKKTTFKQIIKGEFVFKNDSGETPKIEDVEKVYMERLEEIGGKSDTTEDGRYAPTDDIV